MMPFVLARESFANRGAGHVHQFAGFEEVGFQRLAHFEAGVLETDLPKMFVGRHAGLLEVAQRRLRHPFLVHLAEADLHRAVAVLWDGP
jgi:hypothetical protein